MVDHYNYGGAFTSTFTTILLLLLSLSWQGPSPLNSSLLKRGSRMAKRDMHGDHVWHQAFRDLQAGGCCHSGSGTWRSWWRWHWQLNGRPYDRLTWQLSASWAGTSSGSLAACPNRVLRRWLIVSEMDGRLVVTKISSFQMNWSHLSWTASILFITLLWH